jgi:Raf kinase inhibitor-like YbhB/YbcL family protein
VTVTGSTLSAPCADGSGPLRSRAVLARSLASLTVAAALVVVVAACDEGDGKTMRPPTDAERAAMPTTTTTGPPTSVSDVGGTDVAFPSVSTPVGSVAAPGGEALTLTLPWAEGSAIDVRFTCDGGDVSPTISWGAPPAGTVEMALLMVDDTAGGYVHWAVAGIPPEAGGAAEGTPIPGAIEGINGFGNPGYGGPCPPAGTTHTYSTTLYALSQQAELPGDFTGDDLTPVASAAAIATATVTATYARPAG